MCPSPRPYKQSATLPRRCQVSRAAPGQETYLPQTHFCKTETTRNNFRQNASQNSTSNKLPIYINITILKQIWTYGIQLWGTASTYNIQILERLQSKALHMIVDEPWYVPNMVIRRDLQIPTVKGEICSYSSQYSARFSAHANGLVVNLTEQPDHRQL
jgi:hypothetical protein